MQISSLNRNPSLKNGFQKMNILHPKSAMVSKQTGKNSALRKWKNSPMLWKMGFPFKFPWQFPAAALKPKSLAKFPRSRNREILEGLVNMVNVNYILTLEAQRYSIYVSLVFLSPKFQSALLYGQPCSVTGHFEASAPSE